MRFEIGVGVTEEWVEQAFPLLEEAGFKIVGTGRAKGSDGEYIWCEIDYQGESPLPFERMVELISRVRGIVDSSMVPGIDLSIVRDQENATATE
jgi:hypothetical protein